MSDFQIVKYKHGKLAFHVLTYHGSVLKYRNGQLKSIRDVLYSEDLFLDHRKGTRPSKDQIKAAFQDQKLSQIHQFIIESGTLEVSQEEFKDARSHQRAKIVNHFHKYYVDPKTKLPIPVNRIENALDQIKFIPNTDLTVDKMVELALKKLVGVLPMRKDETLGTLSIPNQYSNACIRILTQYTVVESKKKIGDNWDIAIRFSPADYDAMFEEIQKATNGEYSLKLEERVKLPSSPATQDSSSSSVKAGIANKDQDVSPKNKASVGGKNKVKKGGKQ